MQMKLVVDVAGKQVVETILPLECEVRGAAILVLGIVSIVPKL